jgi:hypothetical protein
MEKNASRITPQSKINVAISKINRRVEKNKIKGEESVNNPSVLNTLIEKFLRYKSENKKIKIEGSKRK